VQCLKTPLYAPQTSKKKRASSYEQIAGLVITMVQPIDSQTGATWLPKGGIVNSWDQICSREKLGRKSCGFLLLY